MAIHVSRLVIRNFRNFRDIDVRLGEKAVIVGANMSGKTNLIHALRLVLDPALSDAQRTLKEEDFWDGIPEPMANRLEISIAVDLQGFEDNDALLALLADFLVEGEEQPTARLTYQFAPLPSLGDPVASEDDQEYAFQVFGGHEMANEFGHQKRKHMPVMVLHALRDAERDLERWRGSPLRPLVERLHVAKDQLRSAGEQMQRASDEVVGIAEIRTLAGEIRERVDRILGSPSDVAPTLGIASGDPFRIIRSLRLFIDGDKRRPIGDSSLGIANVLYLVLLLLDLEQRELAVERASTILAIEEPEAHLHPHLQRLVYSDLLRRSASVVLTTHSPHIVSVSPLMSLVVLREDTEQGTRAYSTAGIDLTETQAMDLERYLDATRGEMVFAHRVILVEGDSELYVVPAAASLRGIFLDQMGTTVCSVHGTDFLPYVRLLGRSGLNTPYVVITDGDPLVENGSLRMRGVERGMRLVGEDDADRVRRLYDAGELREARELLKSMGVFVGIDSLEIDLVMSGSGDAMLNAIAELGASSGRQAQFREAISDYTDPTPEHRKYILSCVELFGKGRFAQRLAPRLQEGGLPAYIVEAIDALRK